MSGATATSDTLSIAQEDPRVSESLVLIDEMNVFSKQTYPEDDGNGIIASTPEQLAQGVFVVARLDGVAVGTGGLLAHPPVDGFSAMEVKRMYVREQARGRRIAEQVLRWLEIVAKARGVQKLVLLCGPRQPSALRLYERCGYSVRSAFGKHQAHPLSIFFEKRLS